MIANLNLHDLIRRAVTKRPDHLLGDASLLWERFELELAPIIGQAGFESLFMRSLTVASLEFPWLLSEKSADNDAVPTYIPFRGLTSTLTSRTQSDRADAIVTLLIVFTDILCTLIGASLTSKILASAWGDEATTMSASE